MTVMRRAALVLALALGLIASITAAPASATAQARVGCSISPQTGYVYMYDGQNCTGSSAFIGTSGRLNQCFNLTIHGSPPNGWSNKIRSLENKTSVAFGFYDAFNCDGPVLFAMDSGTARSTLNSLADQKASSYFVSIFPAWT